MLPVILGQGGGGYYAEAVRFDGANDYLLRGGTLTAAADSKYGIISFWMKSNINGIARYIQDGNIQIILDSANNFSIQVVDTAANVNLVLQYSNITISDGWTHILASWDATSGNANLYINNTLDRDWETT